MLGPMHAYCGVMLPLCEHPNNGNSVICIDLSKPLPDLSELTENDVQRLLFTRGDELKDNEVRLPIKEIHLNKCPAVAPLAVMDLKSQERLGIDVDDCLHVADWMLSLLPEFLPKLLKAYQTREFDAIEDPDYALYSGGFFSQKDRNLIAKIQRSDFESLASETFDFEDHRLDELLFRYRARNAPQTLSAEEKIRWRQVCRDKIKADADSLDSRFADYFAQLKTLQDNVEHDQQSILQAVYRYAEELQQKLNNE